MEISVPKNLDSPQISLTTVQNSDDEIMVRRGLEQETSEINLIPEVTSGDVKLPLAPIKQNGFMLQTTSQRQLSSRGVRTREERYRSEDYEMLRESDEEVTGAIEMGKLTFA